MPLAGSFARARGIAVSVVFLGCLGLPARAFKLEAVVGAGLGFVGCHLLELPVHKVPEGVGGCGTALKSAAEEEHVAVLAGEEPPRCFRGASASSATIPALPVEFTNVAEGT